MTKEEQLALLEALYKRVKVALDDLKGEMKDELMELNSDYGVDRKKIICNGLPVGEIGISYSTPKPYIKPGKEVEAMKFLERVGLVETTPAKGWEKDFVNVGGNILFVHTGEFVDFLDWQPSVPKTASVRGCKPEVVLEAMQHQITGETFIGLLEGGNEV